MKFDELSLYRDLPASSKIVPQPAINSEISTRISIAQRTVAQLSWAHNIILMHKLKVDL